MCTLSRVSKRFHRLEEVMNAGRPTMKKQEGNYWATRRDASACLFFDVVKLNVLDCNVIEGMSGVRCVRDYYYSLLIL